MKTVHLWLLLPALVLGLSGCGRSGESTPPVEEVQTQEGAASGEITLTVEKAKEAGVETEPARTRLMQNELKVAGTVTSTAKGRALVTPTTPGKILRLFAGPGDKVRHGQSLALIQSSDMAQASAATAEAERGRSAAAADVRRASSELDLAKSRLSATLAQLSRQTALAKAGAFSQPSLQAAESEVNEAKAELQSVQEDESVHKIQLERAERLFQQELISRTDLEQARLAVSQDQVRHQRAENRVRIALGALHREQDIAQKGLLTAREVQSAEAEVRAARLEVQRAQIGLDAARSSLSSAARAVQNARANSSAVRGSGNKGTGSLITLTAPIGGTVTERKATIGQSVEAASELFEIENLDTVWVTANVPEKEIESVTRGLRVRLTAASYPGRSFVGVVQFLGSHLDPKTRTLPVQCVVENRSGLLREGMFATVLLGIGKALSTLSVPDAAVYRNGGDLAVFVLSGEKFEKRAVTIGRSSSGFTEILSGLKEGEQVVTKGLFILVSESRKDELKGEE